MMKEHIILGVMWLLFCVFHSMLASLSVKEFVEKKTGRWFKHYRIFYTLFAFLTLGIVLFYQLKIDSPLLFKTSVFSFAIGLLLSIVGLIIMGICIKKYFISLSGLKSLFESKPSHTLITNGIHRYVRHPLYLGTFIFIWSFFITFPYLSLFIANFIITLYTLIGIQLEEKKLEIEFGNEYLKYKHQVPKLLPLIRVKRA